MKLELIPSKLAGDIVIPPSKSLAHRGIIAASLATGKSKITNLNFSNDITITTDAMKGLGVDIEVFEDYEIINGKEKLKRINKV
ncbi:MAG: 3-phosphoshikimate 1-carboxyvinyltransferase, partial [Psychrilyobacter sp.]|nr:3-phosphoshikimate 1-carboxyvinyltransferase [Psychrilyobacter sp.]